MGSDPYEKLREHLDSFPTSFPKSKDGVEMKILRKLFSEEEAEVAARLPLWKSDAPPEDVASIAQRLGKDAERIRPIVRSMEEKGLVYGRGGKEDRTYALLPFVPGIMEFSVFRLDPELAQWFDQYEFGAMGREIVKNKMSVGRIIPVHESISAETSVQPGQEVIRAIETSTSLCVIPCHCRAKMKELGQDCGRPIEVCLYMNEYADYLIETGKAKKLTREEAKQSMWKAEDAGLIHIATNTREGMLYICSCCGCCCSGLRGILIGLKTTKIDFAPKSDFIVRLDADQCTACESCVERCWTGALAVEDESLVIDHARCIGCGACIRACPSEALRLVRKPDEEIRSIPGDFASMFGEIGWRHRESQALVPENGNRSGAKTEVCKEDTNELG
jgi:Na+-translocating ferredoxin:NAD+ oxidoreductase subunit B